MKKLFLIIYCDRFEGPYDLSETIEAYNVYEAIEEFDTTQPVEKYRDIHSVIRVK